MDFCLSEEQQMLADSLARFVTREYAFATRRALAASAAGFSERNWQLFAELGLLGLIVPAEFGGLGGNAADTLVVMEQLGRGLVLEPVLPCAIVAASLVADAATPTQREALLPGMIDGSTRMAVASLEPGARFDLWQVATTATARASGFVLNGRKAVVWHGAAAHTLIVSARTAGDGAACAGITLFLVPADAPGVGIKDFPGIDGQRFAEIALVDVKVESTAVIGKLDHGYTILEQAIDRGIAALCAEAVGAMTRLAELTAEYLRTRKQFGQPIGSFQALQHRYADMLIAIEQARAMAYCAAAAVDQPDEAARRRAVSAAKSLIGRSARFVAQQAIQLHGGMGMTDELSVGYYAKRLNCIDMTWGNAEHHLELYSNSM